MTADSRAEDWVMDGAYIAANHVVDRYVLGQLSEADTDAFERAMLDSPDLQDEVEMADAMQAQIKLAAPRLEPAPQNSPDLPWNRRLGFVSAALTLVLGVPLALSLSTISTLHGQLRNPVALGPVIALETTRGANAPTRVAARTPIVLALDVGPTPAGSYTVTIESDAGETLTVDAASPDARNKVFVYVPALQPGAYRAAAAPDNSNEAKVSFSLVAE